MGTAAIHQNVLPHDWMQPLAFVAGVVLFYFTIAAGQKLSEPSPPALGLTVRREGPQIRIRWDRGATGASLNIEDGTRRTALFVSSRLSGVTYEAETADVVVRLAGKKSAEIARCLVQESDAASILNRDLETTRLRVMELQKVIRWRTERVRQLQAMADNLFTKIPPPQRRSSTTWWR